MYAGDRDPMKNAHGTYMMDLSYTLLHLYLTPQPTDSLYTYMYMLRRDWLVGLALVTSAVPQGATPQAHSKQRAK